MDLNPEHSSGLSQWFTSCARQMTQHDAFVTGGFDAAHDRLLDLSHGRCVLTASEPAKFISFGVSDIQLSATTFRFLSLRSSTECWKFTSLASNNDDVILHWLLSGELDIAQNGRQLHVRAGQLFIVGAGGRTVKHWHGACELLIVFVRRETLKRALREEYSLDSADSSDFDGLTSIDFPDVSALAQFIATVVSDMSRNPSVFKDRSIAAHAERTLDLLLLRSLSPDRLPAFDFGSSASPFYVRRAEAFLRENLTEPVTMEQLAAAAGVSARTLYYGFREYRASSPMKFLKVLRLKAAHAALQDSEMGGARISEIAARCGYSSLSHFSRDYHAFFGESPSKTARSN